MSNYTRTKTKGQKAKDKKSNACRRWKQGFKNKQDK